MRRSFPLFVCCLLFLCLAISSWANGLTFNFTLTRSGYTSAGAFKSDGTLVKTLWRHVYFTPGSYTRTWDGTDDTGTVQNPGTYTIKVLSHTMRYYWDGVIGNTSSSFADRTLWHTCTISGIQTLAIDGTNAFAAMGTDEGQPAIRRFSTSNANSINGKINWILWISYPLVATDGTRFYVAGGSSGYHLSFCPNSPTGTWVTSYNVSDNSWATFTNGQTVDEKQLMDGVPGSGEYVIPSAIDYDEQPAGVYPHYATGLAVQKTGNVLAVAHGDLNVIRCFNKISGAALPNISVTNPQKIVFAPNGDLWVITGTTVVRYAEVGTSGCYVATTINGLQKPLDVAVHPSDNNVVMIADGGASQQVKCFNSTGVAQWTFGRLGGYDSVNVVDPNSDTSARISYIDAQYGYEGACIAIQSDGSFWISDRGNMRMLHINRSLNPAYVGQLSWIMGNRVACDPNNPTRLFWGFHEYQIDYSKPLMPGDPGAAGGNGCWKLVRNWRYAVPSTYTSPYVPGFMSVVTLSNGRTYARLTKENSDPEIVELPASGPLRYTGITVPGPMYANGDIRYYTLDNNVMTIYNKALTGFDGAGNPQWGTPTVLATTPSLPTDPCGSPGDASDWNGKMLPITSSNMLISLKYSCGGGYEGGMHLGGLPVSGTQWRWKASPGIVNDYPTDGMGSYPVDAFGSNAGINVWASGQNILMGYNGQNSPGSNQYKHFWDDGLFIGQFGVAPEEVYTDGSAIPGMNSNAMSMSDLVTVNGVTYFYVDDESQHSGIHRLRMEGQGTIQEAVGSGAWNGTVTLTNPTTAFPTELTAVPGDGKVFLSWNAAAGATSYNIKRSATRGGTYTNLATGVTTTSYTVTGLTNGTPYYYLVTAVVSGVESAASNELLARSYPATPAVQGIGNMLENNGKIHRITSTAPQSSTPALTDINPILCGDFPLQQLGRRGYIVYSFDGDGLDRSNITGPFTVSVGATGWQIDHYLGRFSIDGILGQPYGLQTRSTGTIDITVSDDNWHYLTVYAPDCFADERNCTYTLTPQGLSSPAVSYHIVESGGNGRPHWLQFLIRGNVTLTVVNNGTGYNNSANVQALFFDDVSNPIVAPTFSVAPGNYQNAQTVTISTPTNGAAIRYTTDGSTPTATTGTVYSTPVSISTTTILKAIAYKTGLAYSTVTSGVYMISDLNISGLAYTTTDSTAFVADTRNVGTSTAAMSLALSGYTGSIPTSAIGKSGVVILNWQNSGTDQVTLAPGFTFSRSGAWGQKDDHGICGENTWSYINSGGTTVTPASSAGLVLGYQQVGTFTITVPAGDTDLHTLTLFQTSIWGKPGAALYTLTSADGLSSATATYDPAKAQAIEQFTFRGNVTLSVTGEVDFWDNGDWPRYQALLIDGGTDIVAAPTFSPAAGTYSSPQTVTMSTATSGASIRYTTDGSTPTATTGTVYSTPVSIPATTTLKAIAYKSGMTDSAVTSGTYTITGGTGLTGTYFSNKTLTTPATLTRTDSQVNFDWGSGSPDGTLPADNFSVRWTGKIQATVAGSYTFSTTTDDGVRLWINGQQVIDNWTDHGTTTDTSSPITLTAGQQVTITMEYYENGGGAVAKLLWTPPSGTIVAIPQAQLYVP